jgi:hypothetical protein
VRWATLLVLAIFPCYHRLRTKLSINSGAICAQWLRINQANALHGHREVVMDMQLNSCYREIPKQPKGQVKKLPGFATRYGSAIELRSIGAGNCVVFWRYGQVRVTGRDYEYGHLQICNRAGLDQDLLEFDAIDNAIELSGGSAVRDAIRSAWPSTNNFVPPQG